MIIIDPDQMIVWANEVPLVMRCVSSLSDLGGTLRTTETAWTMLDPITECATGTVVITMGCTPSNS